MSLLTACQDASDEIGVIQPTTVASGLDTTSRKLFRMAKKVGKDLMQFHAWQVLRTETTFTATAGSEQSSILPSDFDRFVPETFWNRTDKYLLVGPVKPVEWNSLKAQAATGDSSHFIHRANSIFFYPDAAGGDTYAFEYVSENYADVAATGNPKNAFTLDDDVFRLDEELLTLGIIYEFLHADGLESAVAKADYETRRSRLIKNEGGSSGVVPAADIFATNSRHNTGEPSNTAQSILSS